MAGGGEPWDIPQALLLWALREGTDILVERETLEESEKLSWRPSQPAVPQSWGGTQNFQLSVMKSVYSMGPTKVGTSVINPTDPSREFPSTLLPV